MSLAVSCKLFCQCGGHIQHLPDDGVYYVLTEEHTIIFRGMCNQCGGGVRVERPILSLMVRCPSDAQRAN
jgi:hypothetical protein